MKRAEIRLSCEFDFNIGPIDDSTIIVLLRPDAAEMHGYCSFRPQPIKKDSKCR